MMTSHVGSPHDQSDVLLLARMRSGDAAALDLLLEQYWAPLVTYSGRLLNSHDMAEDVVQEAFIRLWEHRERWSLEGSVRALLYKITRNVATDVLRRMGGIRIVRNPNYAGKFRFYVLMSRTTGARSFELQQGPCFPIIFIDRHYMGRSDEFDIDIFLPLLDVEAVEAHSGLSVPVSSRVVAFNVASSCFGRGEDSTSPPHPG